MLLKLQKKTLVKSQILGYGLTLFVGLVIIMITLQLYFDIRPLMQEQTDVFKNQSAIISKNVSIFSGKDNLYFTEEDIKELQSQDFVKEVSKFKSASFKIGAFTQSFGGQIPGFRTDLFFESIPENYLDVKPEEWKWEKSQNFIPIIIPENYLNLYNFGFAESQGLPVVSKNIISQIQFNIEIEGNGKRQEFKSKIVGFSNKINSILVPDDFLEWANNEFGRATDEKSNRLLIEFTNPSDENILKFFNEHNYSISKDELEYGRLLFFFKSALFFMLLIAAIIIILSVAFILLSINLIIQKNKELILNLYQIGYGYLRIAKFYVVVVSLVTFISTILAFVVSNYIRQMYLDRIQNFFEFDFGMNIIPFFSIVVLILLIISYTFFLIQSVKKTVGA